MIKAEDFEYLKLGACYTDTLPKFDIQAAHSEMDGGVKVWNCFKIDEKHVPKGFITIQFFPLSKLSLEKRYAVIKFNGFFHDLIFTDPKDIEILKKFNYT